MLINKEKTTLVLIDAQERLIPVVAQSRQVIDGCSRLARGANIFKIPVIVTEQYPKGLGPTLFDVKQYLEKSTFIDKKDFSAFKNTAFIDALEKTKRKQIVLAGVELHICVLQTAIELKNAGYTPFVVIDACSCRHDTDYQTAKERLLQENIPLVTVEMVLYEWLETASASEFKECHTHLLY